MRTCGLLSRPACLRSWLRMRWPLEKLRKHWASPEIVSLLAGASVLTRIQTRVAMSHRRTLRLSEGFKLVPVNAEHLRERGSLGLHLTFFPLWEFLEHLPREVVSVSWTGQSTARTLLCQAAPVRDVLPCSSPLDFRRLGWSPGVFTACKNESRLMGDSVLHH